MSDRSEFELPQPGATDNELLSVFEELDEDELDVDPLEGGVDPPENWQRTTSSGVTPREMLEGETLDERVAAEVPDTPPEEEGTARPAVERPLEDLDSSVDEVVDHGDAGPEEGMELEPTEVGPTGEPIEDFPAWSGNPTGAAEDMSVHPTTELD